MLGTSSSPNLTSLRPNAPDVKRKYKEGDAAHSHIAEEKMDHDAVVSEAAEDKTSLVEPSKKKSRAETGATRGTASHTKITPIQTRSTAPHAVRRNKANEKKKNKNNHKKAKTVAKEIQEDELKARENIESVDKKLEALYPELHRAMKELAL